MALCEIRGTIQGLDESPIAEAQVRATVQLTEADQSGQVVGGAGITSDPIVAFTDVTGRFSIFLKQGAVAHLEIPVINLARFITVPSVGGPVEFDELI
jgi:hypothetical protein